MLTFLYLGIVFTLSAQDSDFKEITIYELVQSAQVNSKESPAEYRNIPTELLVSSGSESGKKYKPGERMVLVKPATKQFACINPNFLLPHERLESIVLRKRKGDMKR